MFQPARQMATQSMSAGAGDRATSKVSASPIGNQALLRRLQAKLTVSQPGDQFEQEADRVSEQVMRMPAPAISRSSIPKINRKCEKCEEDEMKVDRKETGDVPVSEVGDVGEPLRSGGQSLDAATREFLEPRFGYDFSHVRVHTDDKAAAAATSVRARAYTVGNDIVFGSGQYRPATGDGKRLLAHELTHVVQQGHAGGRDSGQSIPQVQRQGADASTGVSLAYDAQKPVSGGCGDFSWQVKFKLNGATDQTNGFVVQKVKTVSLSQKCDDTPDDVFTVYWEAWQVKNGKIMSGLTDRESLGDEFKWSNTSGSKGSDYVTGAAKFMEGYTEPLKWGHVKEAGGTLPATYDQPAGWAEAGSKYRYVGKPNYFCCDGKHETSEVQTEELDV